MQRGITVLMTVVLVFSLFLALDVKPASACSCVMPPPTDEKVARSDAVFSGKVIQADQPASGSSAQSVEYVIEVDSVWKGKINQQTTVTSPASSASCGYEFETGQSYLIYADMNQGNWKTVSCDGNAKMSESSTSGEIEQLGAPIAIEPGADGDVNTMMQKSSSGIIWWSIGVLLLIGGIVIGFVWRKRRRSL